MPNPPPADEVIDRFLVRYNQYRGTSFARKTRTAENVVQARDTQDRSRFFELYRLADGEYQDQMNSYLQLKSSGKSDDEIGCEGGVLVTAYRAVPYTLAEAMADRLATLYRQQLKRESPTTVVLWADAASFPEPMFLPSPFEPSRTNLEHAERLIATRFAKLVPRAGVDELMVFEYPQGLREMSIG